MKGLPSRLEIGGQPQLSGRAYFRSGTPSRLEIGGQPQRVLALGFNEKSLAAWRSGANRNSWNDRLVRLTSLAAWRSGANRNK